MHVRVAVFIFLKTNYCWVCYTSATMSATSGNSATQGRVDVHNEHSSPSSHIPNPYLMHMRTICGPLHGGGEAHPTITNHQSPAIFAEPVSALQIYYWRARI